MIVAAGLLVLGGLGLFVAGVLTGGTALYWACVGACGVAAVLLLLARRRMTAAAGTPAASRVSAPPTAAAVTSGGRHAGSSTAATTGIAAPAAVSGNGAAPPAAAPPAAAPPAAPATTAPATAAPAVPVEEGEPPVEEGEVTDLLLVVDLRDEVLVVDEHPRYHVAGCAHLVGRETFPLPVDEARTDGFTPCGVCRPDATLAGRVRARRATGGA